MPETGNHLDLLNRREKWQLRLTCFFATLVLVIYAGAKIFAESSFKEAVRLKETGTPALEINRLNGKTMAIMNVAAFGIVVAFFCFVIYFASWLSSFRRRRRESTGQKASE